MSSTVCLTTASTNSIQDARVVEMTATTNQTMKQETAVENAPASTGAGKQATAAPAASSTGYNPLKDPELEVKNIILSVLTHGAKCQSPQGRCLFPSCTESKAMIRHVTRCLDSNKCGMDFCANSKFVLKHAPQIQQGVAMLCQANENDPVAFRAKAFSLVANPMNNEDQVGESAKDDLLLVNDILLDLSKQSDTEDEQQIGKFVPLSRWDVESSNGGGSEENMIRNSVTPLDSETLQVSLGRKSTANLDMEDSDEEDGDEQQAKTVGQNLDKSNDSEEMPSLDRNKSAGTTGSSQWNVDYDEEDDEDEFEEDTVPIIIPDHASGASLLNTSSHHSGASAGSSNVSASYAVKKGDKLMKENSDDDYSEYEEDMSEDDVHIKANVEGKASRQERFNFSRAFSVSSLVSNGSCNWELEDIEEEDEDDDELQHSGQASVVVDVPDTLSEMAAEEDAIVYTQVKHQRVVGSLELLQHEIKFVPEKGAGSFTISWSNVSKHQMSPSPHCFLKLVLCDGPAAEFQLVNRESLEDLRADVKTAIKASKSVRASNQPDRPAPSKDSRKKNGSKSKTPSSSVTTFSDVYYKTHFGSLSFHEDYVCFQYAKDNGKILSKYFHYDVIAKHNMSPDNVQKALLRIIATGSKATTFFEVRDRSALKQTYEEMNSRLLAYRLKKEGKIKGAQSASKHKASTSAKTQTFLHHFDNISYQKMKGSIKLYKEKLTFTPDPSNGVNTDTRSVSWDDVAKHQTSPNTYAKALLKLELANGRAITFELRDREELARLRKAVKSLLQKVKNDSNQSTSTSGTVDHGPPLPIRRSRSADDVSTKYAAPRSLGPKSGLSHGSDGGPPSRRPPGPSRSFSNASRRPPEQRRVAPSRSFSGGQARSNSSFAISMMSPIHENRVRKPPSGGTNKMHMPTSGFSKWNDLDDSQMSASGRKPHSTMDSSTRSRVSGNTMDSSTRSRVSGRNAMDSSTRSRVTGTGGMDSSTRSRVSGNAMDSSTRSRVSGNKAMDASATSRRTGRGGDGSSLSRQTSVKKMGAFAKEAMSLGMPQLQRTKSR